MNEIQTPPAHDADIKERADGFNKECEQLLAKYEVQMVGFPLITPDGTLSAKIVLISGRQAPEEVPEETKAETPDVPATDSGLLE